MKTDSAVDSKNKTKKKKKGFNSKVYENTKKKVFGMK